MVGVGRGGEESNICFTKVVNVLSYYVPIGFTRNLYYFYSIDLKLKDTKSIYYGILYNLF